MSFATDLLAAVKTNNSLVCVGLDSDRSKLPSGLSQFAFNKAIIDATADLVCAYKPNSAFYEAAGAEGVEQLKQTCDYLNQKYPHIPVILDAKRGDIGNTNNGYVDFAYEYLGVDAITLHPYLGGEALKPFLDRADKGAILMCRNSNPGAGEVQDMMIDGEELYKHMARMISERWNTNHNCLLVVGATFPSELAEVRSITGDDMTFLVPGVGAQGGDVEATLKAGLTANKDGLIINSARGIIFASNGSDFAEAARSETIKLRDQINSFR